MNENTLTVPNAFPWPQSNTIGDKLPKPIKPMPYHKPRKKKTRK